MHCNAHICPPFRKLLRLRKINQSITRNTCLQYPHCIPFSTPRAPQRSKTRRLVLRLLYALLLTTLPFLHVLMCLFSPHRFQSQLRGLSHLLHRFKIRLLLLRTITPFLITSGEISHQISVLELAICAGGARGVRVEQVLRDHGEFGEDGAMPSNSLLSAISKSHRMSIERSIWEKRTAQYALAHGSPPSGNYNCGRSDRTMHRGSTWPTRRCALRNCSAQDHPCLV